MKKLIIVLLAFIAMGGSLKAQVTVSLYPYKYTEHNATYRYIYYYRIYQINKYEHGQNNELTTTNYYHYKHVIPLQLSTLNNVSKIEVKIDINIGVNDGSYPIYKTVNVSSEDGIIMYELDGVKREIKNNRFLIDAELTTNRIVDTSNNLGATFSYVINVYDSSNVSLRNQTYDSSNFHRSDL